MNKYKVMFNFGTGKYDVIDAEADEIVSSWGTHAEAVTERNYLTTGVMEAFPTEK